MERKDNDREGSPLPRSLIPHLMTRDSSTRTTLDSTRSILSSAAGPHDLTQSDLAYLRSTQPNPLLLPPLPAAPVLSSRHHTPRPYFSQDPGPLDAYGRYAASLGSGGMAAIPDRGERISSVSEPLNMPPTSSLRSEFDDPYGLPRLPPLRTQGVAQPLFMQREQIWGDPEAGPSSQLLIPRYDHGGRGRREHSQSRLEPSHEDNLYRRRESPEAGYAAYSAGGSFLHHEAGYTQESSFFTQRMSSILCLQMLDFN